MTTVETALHSYRHLLNKHHPTELKQLACVDAALASLLPAPANGATPRTEEEVRTIAKDQFAAWFDSRVNKNATPSAEYAWIAACHYVFRDFVRPLETSLQAAQAEIAQFKKAADRYWLQLCDTAEALGKIAPEAAPYTVEWAKDLMQVHADTLAKLATSEEYANTLNFKISSLADRLAAVEKQHLAEIDELAAQANLMGNLNATLKEAALEIARNEVTIDELRTENEQLKSEINISQGVKADLISRNVELISDLDAARKDAERLDWLEGELTREQEYIDQNHPWLSLFRRNFPITRAAIDAAMSPDAGEGKK